jgi:hypothetical protein
MTQHIEIVNGPSKSDLQQALFERKPESRGLRPTFKLENGTVITVHVTGVSAEDGSGESWLISGYVSTSFSRLAPHKTFWYRTDIRKGTIRK